jgi:hypothetical protein
VPKGEVSGTVTVGGVSREVHGTGYHDHQWGNSNFWQLFNHWLWARQGFDDYSILVFDFVTAAKYGYRRIPVCFIQNADGNLVFTNTQDVSYVVLEELRDPTSGKDCPKVSRYSFDHDGTQVVYTLTANTIIESRDAMALAPQMVRQKLGKVLDGLVGGIAVALMRWRFRRQGLQPSYTRFAATGDLQLTRDGNTITRFGELIYEFMYPAPSYREHA